MLKTLIIINLLLILLSLAFGVIFLAKDKSSDKRVVASLTVRIILSFSLILLISIGYMTGNIAPHSVQ